MNKMAFSKWMFFFFLLQTFGFTYASTYSVTQDNVVQNMVVNSSQDITFNITTSVATPSVVNVHCAFSTSDSDKISASFNGNGCVSSGGIGVNSTTPATILLTLTVKPGATGLVKGKVIFTKTNGRSETKHVTIQLSITPSARTVQFRNFCTQEVWFGLSSSSVPAKNQNNFPCTTDKDCSDFTFSLCRNGFCGGGACRADADCVNSTTGTCVVPKGSAPNASASCTYCGQDSDCIDGAKCDTANNQCFWALPAPSDAATNNYQLLAFVPGGTPATNTVTIPDHSGSNGFALQWGGGFAGRTFCTNTGGLLGCKTAGCNTSGNGDGNGGCQLGEGFGAPSTSAEVTFSAINPDTYDVTIINGSNIPVSMQPTTGSATTPQSYNNPYLCGSPGSAVSTVTNAGTIGACDWQWTPPSVLFRWVDTDNATNCSTDSTCTSIDSSLRCGLTSVAVSGNSAQGTCGTPLGYWNQNQICAANASYSQSSVVDCTIANVGNSGNSQINLLACTGPAALSCFNIITGSSVCCGCTNWQNHNITVPTNPSIVQQCSFPNSNWVSGGTPNGEGAVLPGLIWLKQACPSAYVYPFDDKTSTFTCPSNNGQSGVNYTVDFCPQS